MHQFVYKLTLTGEGADGVVLYEVVRAHAVVSVSLVGEAAGRAGVAEHVLPHRRPRQVRDSPHFDVVAVKNTVVGVVSRVVFLGGGFWIVKLG